MSNSVGRIDLDLGINTSGFKNQLNGITKQAKGSTGKMSGMFGKLGAAVAAAFAVEKVISFGKACIQLGSDLAEVQNVVDVTFGSMAGKVNEFAKNAMTSYGMSEKVAKEYMGQFGAMSKAFGNTEQMAYDQAAALTGLAGDVASFYNMTTEEAFTKLKSVYTGETETLKSLGVVMTQTALDEYALQKGLGKTTKNMSEQEKVALRLSFVTDRLSDASGDFIRTADGWANQTRVLSLRFESLKATIGQGLINIFLPVIRVINELVAKLQVAADMFKAFTEAVFGSAESKSTGAGIAAASEAAGAIANNVDSAAGSAAKLKKQLAGFDKLNILGSSDTGSSSSGGGTTSSPSIAGTSSEAENTNSTVDAIKAKLDEIKGKLLEIANVTGLKGLWDDFLVSVGNVKTGVMNIFDSFKKGIENNKPQLETLKKSVTDTFLTVSQTITGIWGDVWVQVSQGFADFTEEYKADITEAFTHVTRIVTTQCTLISNAIGDIFGSLKSWWDSDGSRIFDSIIQVVKDVGGWILKIYNEWIFPVIENLQKRMQELWNNHLKPLWDEVLGAVTDICDYIMTVYNKYIKPVIDWLVEVLGPILVPIINNLVNTISNAVSYIITGIKNLLASLRGIIQFVTGVLTGDWEKAWGGIKKAFGAVGDQLKNIVNSIKNHFKIQFDGIKNIASGLWSGIKTTFSAMGSWFKERVNAVKNAFSGAWSSLKSGAKSAWTGVKNVFSSVGTFFKNTFSNAWAAVKKVFSTGGKIFDGIKDGIVSAFKTIVNAIIKGINKVVSVPFDGINRTLNKIKSIKILGAKPFDWIKTISVPKIPYLASGGYVAANTPQLAVIGDNKHEGEIVAPESKIAEAVARGFAMVMAKMQTNQKNDRPIYLNLKIGEQDFWEGFIDYHNSVVKMTGDSPLLV